MKKALKILAVLIVVAFLGSACSQSVCPAYATDTTEAQTSEVAPG